MADVYDVAQYILENKGTIPALKLQKLVYYSHAWSLVWDDHKLFDRKIEAWFNGPVVPALYAMHRQQYEISNLTKGDSSNLSPSEKETINEVLSFYGDRTSQWLSDQTHMEQPWIKARERANATHGERSNEEILNSEIAEYYGSLLNG